MDATFQDVATLYAIYRKDVRAMRVMELKDVEKERATEKQLQYLRDPAERKGIQVPQTLEGLSKEEASKMIEELF